MSAAPMDLGQFEGCRTEPYVSASVYQTGVINAPKVDIATAGISERDAFLRDSAPALLAECRLQRAQIEAYSADSARFAIMAERQRAEIERLRGALNMAARALDGMYPWPINSKFTQTEARTAALKHARAALEGAK